MGFRPVTRIPAAPPLDSGASTLAKGLWRRPFSMPIGSAPGLLLAADDNRMGVWLWASTTAISSAGQATAPAANATIAKLAALAPGVYDVYTSVVFLAGAPTAGADAINWRLVLGVAGTGGQVVGTLSCVLSLNQPVSRSTRITLPQAQDLFVTVAATGTAGVTYQAEISALPLTPAYVGLDSAVLAGAYQQSSGWPIGQDRTLLTTDQELWAVAPGPGPTDLRGIEIVRRGVPWQLRPMEGD